METRRAAAFSSRLVRVLAMGWCAWIEIACSAGARQLPADQGRAQPKSGKQPQQEAVPSEWNGLTQQMDGAPVVLEGVVVGSHEHFSQFGGTMHYPLVRIDTIIKNDVDLELPDLIDVSTPVWELEIRGSGQRLLLFVDSCSDYPHLSCIVRTAPATTALVEYLQGAERDRRCGLRQPEPCFWYPDCDEVNPVWDPPRTRLRESLPDGVELDDS